MKSRTLTCIIAMTLFAALAVPVQLAALKQIRYTVTDLGTLGGTFGNAFRIDHNGSVVGHATLTGDAALHAFLWRDGVTTDQERQRRHQRMGRTRSSFWWYTGRTSSNPFSWAKPRATSLSCL